MFAVLLLFCFVLSLFIVVLLLLLLLLFSLVLFYFCFIQYFVHVVDVLLLSSFVDTTDARPSVIHFNFPQKSQMYKPTKELLLCNLSMGPFLRVIFGRKHEKTTDR